jgi:hypothetical protein
MPISERTPVQVGIVILIVSGVISFTWFASSVHSDLTMLLKVQAKQVESDAEMRRRIDGLERTTDILTQVGSPALRARLEPIEHWKDRVDSVGTPQVIELSKRLLALETSFELHKVETRKTSQ